MHMAMAWRYAAGWMMTVTLWAAHLTMPVAWAAGDEAGSPLVVFDAGRSSVSLYLADGAPASVRQAAEELQHYLARAGGVTLPIMRGDQPPAGPFISLGDNAASRAAGLDASLLPLEGYRLLTRPGRLYIVGHDTPDGQRTPQGGASHGTRHGAYAFLEQHVGVRWLMPGPMGDHVPRQDRLALPVIDHADAPAFARRRVAFIQQHLKDVGLWATRLRLGGTLDLDHGHAWERTIGPELFKDHPDWFAMFDGRRVPPVGTYKLETTNPQLVQAYAQRAVQALRQQPARYPYTYSLSPSDLSGWSQSPQSQAYHEVDPDGGFSVTPLVLKFYTDVANLVKAQAPDKAVAGYIYNEYLYPPAKGLASLPDNLYLVLAPQINYGYELYDPAVRQRFESLLATWAQATDKLGYYDLPNVMPMPQTIGAPAPAALEILAYLYPRLADHRVKSVFIYGKEAWGTGAMGNYVQAKLSWNPHADARALADDFYLHAYGARAGASIKAMDQMLDAKLKALFDARKPGGPSPASVMMQALYAKPYPQIEAHYLEALAHVQDDRQAERLAMLGENLALLQWNLRHLGLVADNPSSPLYRTDEQVQAMLTQRRWPYVLPPGAQAALPPAAPDRLRVQPATQAGLASLRRTPLTFRGAARLALHTPIESVVTIHVPYLASRGDMARYQLMDAQGQSLESGVLATARPITFLAKPGQVYFLDVQARIVAYQLQVQGASFAIKTQSPDGKRPTLHLLGQLTPLHFHVPPASDAFAVTLQSQAPGETVAADILRPDGQVVASLDTSVHAVAQARLQSQGHVGFWTIRFKPPARGVVDDVHVRLSENLSPWLVSDPARLIVVEPAQVAQE